VNTLWARIIPKIAIAYNFFLMQQFMVQVPDTIIESAKIDGASELRTFWRIVMPNLKPAWATLVVFSFVANWNDYFTPLIMITSQQLKTIPVALQNLGGTIAVAGAVSAATFIMIIPTIVIYVIMQKQVMQTMMHSGIKE
jgi:ABC-type glycerol-3-phosphate transport system permease component